MAIPTNTFTSYDESALREDIIDVITNISPQDNWFTANSGTARATQRYHQWPTDVIRAAAANAVIEGDDASATAITPLVLAGNFTQILRGVFQITDSEEAFNKVGRGSESTYQTQQELKGLAGDLEYALVINATAVSGNTATARQLKGAIGWITTNVTTGTGSGDEALTQPMFNDNLQLMWGQAGAPRSINILSGAFQKRTIDGWTTNTREITAESKTLVSAVDVYKSSFGTVLVRLHQQINTTAPGTMLLFGDMSLWRKAWARPIKPELLARTGGSKKYMIEMELTLEARQQKSAGKITQLTTA